MKWLTIPWGLALFMFGVGWIALGNLLDAAIGAAFYVWVAALVTWQVRRLNANDTSRKQTEPPAKDLGPANLNRHPQGQRHRP